MSHAFARYGANDQERARLLNIAQPETTEGIEPQTQNTQKNR
jgi:hypothetical protein